MLGRTGISPISVASAWISASSAGILGWVFDVFGCRCLDACIMFASLESRLYFSQGVPQVSQQTCTNICRTLEAGTVTMIHPATHCQNREPCCPGQFDARALRMLRCQKKQVDGIGWLLACIWQEEISRRKEKSGEVSVKRTNARKRLVTPVHTAVLVIISGPSKHRVISKIIKASSDVMVVGQPRRQGAAPQHRSSLPKRQEGRLTQPGREPCVKVASKHGNQIHLSHYSMYF